MRNRIKVIECYFVSARKLLLFESLIRKRQRQGFRPDRYRDEIKEFTLVNDCFKNESNAVFGVFLLRLFKIDFSTNDSSTL